MIPLDFVEHHKSKPDNLFYSLRSEEACIDHLFNSRWPDGFRCPDCGHARAYTIRSRRLPLYQCALCRRQTSLIKGTVMEGSRTPLCKWLIAIRLLSRERGITAVRLSSILKVTYKTAWLMLHKIRIAISELDANRPLSGTVQIGLRYYDRLKSIRRPRSYPFFVLAALSEENEPVQIKMKLAPTRNGHPDTARHTLRAFCDKHARASANESRRLTYRIAKGLHDSFRQAVQWINLTYNGLGSRHMQLYWDEFCYRKNLSLRNVNVFAHLSGLCMGRGIH